MQEDGLGALLHRISVASQTKTVFKIGSVDKQGLFEPAFFRENWNWYQATGCHRNLEASVIGVDRSSRNPEPAINVSRDKQCDPVSPRAYVISPEHCIDEG